MALLSTATALTPLLLLACPIGMGAMMFFMMRGSGRKRESDAPAGTEATSVAELKAEHARLGEPTGPWLCDAADEPADPQGRPTTRVSRQPVER